MSPLRKAIEELRRRKQILDFSMPSNVEGVPEHTRFEIILLEDAEDILQEMEIDMINEFDKNNIKETKSDYPKQSY